MTRLITHAGYRIYSPFATHPYRQTHAYSGFFFFSLGRSESSRNTGPFVWFLLGLFFFDISSLIVHLHTRHIHIMHICLFSFMKFTLCLPTGQSSFKCTSTYLPFHLPIQCHQFHFYWPNLPGLPLDSHYHFTMVYRL